MASTQEDLQLTLDTLQPERAAPGTGQNRLCVCISDLHFTDDSVGDQSPDETVWPTFFDEIVHTCETRQIDDLILILDGDVVDMIRSAEWAKSQVYPWQRNHPGFADCLTRIMAKIVALHARLPSRDNPWDAGFFYLLQNTANDLRRKGIQVEVLTLLGNHDKEIFAVPEVLKTFYEQCLGQPVAKLPAAYRQWVGRMYFDDASHFAAPDSIPWLPFYWGDADLRLFITHGQWRDRDNCLSTAAGNAHPGWSTGDGWRTKIWQQLNYQPFTAPCFGDTVAAGALSTFIYRSYLALDEYDKNTRRDPKPDLTRIKRILGELDLYRPTSAAVSRILEETRNKADDDVRDIIEAELYKALCEWLKDDFVLESSPAARRFGLKIARVWLMLTGRFEMFRIQLQVVRGILLLADMLEKILPESVYSEDGASFKNLQTFPTFQDAFLAQGFRLHGEGHTHIPLETEANITPPQPSKHNNFNYINFGAWRDQVVNKEKGGYRRRGVGRALYVLNLQKQPSGQYTYYVRDNLGWSDDMDSLG